MAFKDGTNRACARCKYQRRKCTSECVLAPFFPPDQPKIFQNAHKLFGVSNILKILKDLDENQRTEAMRSIIYESNIRHKFPVHGCLGVILQYQYEIQEMEEELHHVQKQLALCQQQQSSQSHFLRQNGLGFYKTPKCIATWPIDSDPSYSYSGDAVIVVDQNDSNKSIKKNGKNQMVPQKQLLGLDIEQDVVDQDYEFLDTIDETQSYLDSKEAFESSSDSYMKNSRHCIEHTAKNELKTAAACFSLTSAN